MSTELSFTRGNSLQRIVFDSATRSMTFEAELTNSPQEKAAVATDGWINKPDAVTLNCKLTDYPIGGLAEPGRAVRLFNELKEVKAAGLVCALATPTQSFDALRINRISLTQEKPRTGIMEFSISLQQSVVADSQTVPLVTSAERKPQPLTDKGKKGTGDGSDKTNKSYAASAVDGIKDGVMQLIPESWKR